MKSKIISLTFLCSSLSSCVSMDRNIGNISNEPHSPFSQEEVLIDTDTLIKILAKGNAYINMLKKNVTRIYLFISENDKQRLISDNKEIVALTKERIVNIDLIIKLRLRIHVFEEFVIHNKVVNPTDFSFFGEIDLSYASLHTIEEYKKMNPNKRFKIITEKNIDEFN